MMAKVMTDLKIIKRQLINNQINNGQVFHAVETNSEIVGTIPQITQINWIDLEHYNANAEDRLRMAKLNHDNRVVISIAYDFNKIQKVREYSGRDCSLIDNSRKHPKIVSRPKLIKLINRTMVDLNRNNVE